MKVETEVSAFVVRKNMVPHYKTLETAAKEVDEYDFMRICDGHYICKHKDTAYRITIDGDKIGCSCPAMTFHCKGNDMCKHLVAFDRRSAPQKPISNDIAMELIKAGWTGEPGNMTPPDTADAEHEALIDSAANAGWSKEHPETTSDEDGEDNGGGDPVPPDAEKPEPPEKITVTCQYCMKRATRNSQAEADAWLNNHPCKDRPRQKMIVMKCRWCGVKFEGLLTAGLKGEVEAHEMVCDKRPEADSEPPLGAKVYSRTCPHCDQRFDGTDLDEVKDRHREHIPICPKNPANKQRQKVDSSKTEPTETPPEQKPIVKESLTPKTQPKQEEEMQMEKETKETYVHPDGTGFGSAEALLDYAEKKKEAVQMRETKALMAPSNTTTITAQEWSDEQIEVMKKTVAAKATPAEFAYFMNVAAATGLNPFLREIYFMKTDKGQTSIITGRDGYLTIAKRDLRFMGVHSMEVCENDEFAMGTAITEDGTIKQTVTHSITDFKDRGAILGAWARGQMKGEAPVIVYASIKEYDKGGNTWKVYKSAMIRKVVESMVLKRIAGISGLVTESEATESKDMVLDAEVVG